MEHKHNNSHHVTPIPVYIWTLLALVVLTVVTVGASYFDFGRFNIVVSLAIATVKASLVMAFFMGLKYDNNLNRGVILSSFVALAIMISITASDLWVRPVETPVVVRASAAALSQEEFDKLLAQSTPEQMAKGKGLFDTNCAVCHGNEGKGDGIGGGSLNPKPRNFHDAGSAWTNGNSTHSMYVTLLYGVPNTGMASYKALPPADRIALIHYVHSWTGSSHTGKVDEKFAAAVKEDGIGAAGVAAGPKVALPIDFAIERSLKD